MKVLRSAQWSGSVFLPRIRLNCNQFPYLPRHATLRFQSVATAQAQEEGDHAGPLEDLYEDKIQCPINGADGGAESKSKRPRNEHFPSPLPSRFPKSTRLAALHARLALPIRLPVSTLARCLIDASADKHSDFNNTSLSILGNDVLGYLTSEAVLARYPRLPMEVVFSAVSAYIGPRTLATVTREWGVETVHTPGGEVDPGLLQYLRREPGNTLSKAGVPLKEVEEVPEPVSATRPNAKMMLKGWRRGVSSRTIYEDSTGSTIPQPESSTKLQNGTNALRTTYEAASATFIRALMGALYLHCGLRNAKNFYNAHFLSRYLDISALFSFRQPTRDLARLCAREGFDPPIARILSETGRKSRHPVFVVGIFSGREKLGESAGGSLDEARFRAAVNALKGWYLYSPLKWKVPSEVVGAGDVVWEPLMVDGGEVLV